MDLIERAELLKKIGEIINAGGKDACTPEMVQVLLAVIEAERVEGNG